MSRRRNEEEKDGDRKKREKEREIRIDFTTSRKLDISIEIISLPRVVTVENLSGHEAALILKLPTLLWVGKLSQTSPESP